MRRGLVSSRTEAQQAIAAGLVTVDGAPALKAAFQVHAGQAVVVSEPARRYVSRGGEKLAHALATFGVDPTARHALDAGASTGGFTDCLLQHGAQRVIAVDVGYGQLHLRLREDPRVVVLERTNVRDLDPALVPPPAPDLLVADLSFISLARMLPVLRSVLAVRAEAVVLVKPQFEADRGLIGKGGVVRDPQVWAAALHRVVAAAQQLGWAAAGLTVSPLRGPAGNIEFLAHLVEAAPFRQRDPETDPAEERIQALITDTVAAASALRRADRGRPPKPDVAPGAVSTRQPGDTTVRHPGHEEHT